MDPPHQHKKKIIFAFLHELVQNCKIVKKKRFEIGKILFYPSPSENCELLFFRMNPSLTMFFKFYFAI